MGFALNINNGDVLVYPPFTFYVATSAPASPTDGQIYINSIDNKLYVYYNGVWNTLLTLTAGSASSTFLLTEDGFSLLQEDSFKIILDSASTTGSLFLLEDGSDLLDENGIDRLLIEA